MWFFLFWSGLYFCVWVYFISTLTMSDTFKFKEANRLIDCEWHCPSHTIKSPVVLIGLQGQLTTFVPLQSLRLWPPGPLIRSWCWAVFIFIFFLFTLLTTVPLHSLTQHFSAKWGQMLAQLFLFIYIFIHSFIFEQLHSQTSHLLVHSVEGVVSIVLKYEVYIIIGLKCLVCIFCKRWMKFKKKRRLIQSCYNF